MCENWLDFSGRFLVSISSADISLSLQHWLARPGIPLDAPETAKPMGESRGDYVWLSLRLLVGLFEILLLACIVLPLH
jgi:hypothetical protein